MRIEENEDTDHVINELHQISVLSKKLIEKISTQNQQLPKEFITQINHELRTPLTPVRAYTEMLMSGHYGPLSNKQYARIVLIHSNLKQLEKTIENLVKNLSSTKPSKDNKDYSKDSHNFKELEQEKKLLQSINQLLVKQSEKIKKDKTRLEKKLVHAEHNIKELHQTESILKKSKIREEQQIQKLSKKYVYTIAAVVVTVGITMTAYSLYVVDLVGQEYRVPNPEPVRSSYVIQNLKGDTIDTWLSWRLANGDTLYVNIVNAEKYPEQAEIIKDIVLSTEFYEIDNSLTRKAPQGSTSTYYLGWAGALEAASQTPTAFYIPINFEIIDSASGAGDITINLVEYTSGDGYSGWTKSIADDSQNQILKSEITIYDINSLSKNQLATITRHEFGHALGLAHSTATEDLMAPVVTTEFPYISECDVDAIVSLYDDSKKSEVVCEK